MPVTPTEYPAAIEAIRGGVVVSCQAGPESPLYAPHFIAALARSAEMGGAVGFRVDRPENVAAVRAASERPIIGINKIDEAGFEVYITPTFASAAAIVRAGADIVALDGTERCRPNGERLDGLIARIHDELGVPVMADIATAEDGVRAAELGADLLATTLAGYTSNSHRGAGPALDVLGELVARTPVPVIVEGRIWTVEDLRACFEAGAFAVVIGSAITVPQLITRRFVDAIPGRAGPRAGRDRQAATRRVTQGVTQGVPGRPAELPPAPNGSVPPAGKSQESTS